MFENRADAGRQLADLLTDRDINVDVVLAVPRGGLPIGRIIADRFNVPLDIVSARKIGAPHHPELAIGAVASDGTTWLNEPLIDDLGVGASYIEERTEHERQAAAGKIEQYRGDRPPLDVRDKTVLIVDDGIATGATTTACIRQIKNSGAKRVFLAVPVAPPDTVERIRNEVDEVICVETPSHFEAVGQFYESFEQVPDKRAKEYLVPDRT